MKYNNLTLGQIEALINKIGGEEAVHNVLTGEMVVNKTFPTWTKVTVGYSDNLLDICRSANVRLANDAEQVLAFADVYDVQCELELVLVSGVQLGFPGDRTRGEYNGASLSEICERAKEFGLLPCPAEVAVQLVAQDSSGFVRNTVLDHSFLIASAPMRSEDDELGGYDLLHLHSQVDELLYLSAKFTDRADVHWSNTCSWVFMRK